MCIHICAYKPQILTVLKPNLTKFILPFLSGSTSVSNQPTNWRGVFQKLCLGVTHQIKLVLELIGNTDSVF